MKALHDIQTAIWITNNNENEGGSTNDIYAMLAEYDFHVNGQDEESFVTLKHKTLKLYKL